MKEILEIGDIVECVDDSGSSGSISLGRSYEILNTSDHYIYIKNDNDLTGGYYTCRFELSIAYYRTEKLKSIGL